MNRFLPTVTLLACLGLAGCAQGQPEAGSSSSATTPDPSAGASATQAVSPGPSASPGQQTCLAMAQSLTQEQQIGQLLMAGTTDAEPGDALKEAVTQSKVGSVIYLGTEPRSLQDTAWASSQIQSWATAKLPVLLATDQEGGQVQRLQGAGFAEIPSATKQGKLTDAQLRKQWKTWGKQLLAAGVRYDLAPVADVVPPGTDASNAGVGALDRNYGTDDATVAAKSTAVVQGLSDAGIASSLKHFPGLGRAAVNTDFGAATDDQTTLDMVDSFTGPMQAGASSVMISSTIYTKIDPGVHAVFSSKIINDGLRQKLGWQKVVVSDDLGAAAAVKEVPVGERGARFIAAGGDLVINADASSIKDMADGIRAKAAQDKAFADQLDDHAARVLALKAEVGLVKCTPEA
ncbi:MULTISPECIES: glycoside hydrolase family 3 N-terminal domain-containing protein [unclassified Luteococcus]|uniref:glycoside hydrolase family 3 N-terminal domain-containing protein n=1 Tax=unclassified Luteococcus TaxID=2639923 RepID=UPI00313B07F2